MDEEGEEGEEDKEEEEDLGGDEDENVERFEYYQFKNRIQQLREKLNSQFFIYYLQT